MKLNNIQKVCYTFGVLAFFILLVDWVAGKEWLIHPRDAAQPNENEFIIWTIFIALATEGLVFLWKSKK